MRRRLYNSATSLAVLTTFSRPVARALLLISTALLSDKAYDDHRYERERELALYSSDLVSASAGNAAVSLFCMRTFLTQSNARAFSSCAALRTLIHDIIMASRNIIVSSTRLNRRHFQSGSFSTSEKFQALSRAVLRRLAIIRICISIMMQPYS